MKIRPYHIASLFCCLHRFTDYTYECIKTGPLSSSPLWLLLSFWSISNSRERIPLHNGLVALRPPQRQWSFSPHHNHLLCGSITDFVTTLNLAFLNSVLGIWLLTSISYTSSSLFVVFPLQQTFKLIRTYSLLTIEFILLSLPYLSSLIKNVYANVKRKFRELYLIWIFYWARNKLFMNRDISNLKLVGSSEAWRYRMAYKVKMRKLFNI